MEEGFRLAGAYVEVNLKDNTEKTLDKIKAQIEEMSSDLKIGADTREAQSKLDKFKAMVNGTRADLKIGADTGLADKTVGGLKEKVNSTEGKLRVSASNPLDAAWKSRIDAALKSAALEGLRIPLNADTAEFHAKLEAALAELSRQAKIAVGADLDPEAKAVLKAKTEALTHEVVGHIKIEAEADEESAVAAGIEVSKTAADSAGKSSKQPMSHVGRIIALSIAGGITAGGPLIAGAGVLAVGAGVVAMAVAIEKSSPQIQAAWKRFSDVGKETLTQGFSALTPVISNVLDQWTVGVHRMEPLFGQLASATIPFVHEMSDSLMSFTQTSLNGFIGVMQRSGPIVNSLGEGIKIVGNDIKLMFDKLNFSPDASNGLKTLLSDLGGLLPMLSDVLNAVMPLGNAILVLFGDVEQVVSGIAQGLTPVLRVVGDLITNLSTPIADTGIAFLGLMGTMKLFGTSISDVTKLVKGLALAQTAEDVASAGSAFGKASTGISGYLTGLSGIAKTSEGVATKSGALGTALSTLGTNVMRVGSVALPAFTVGALAVGGVMEILNGRAMTAGYSLSDMHNSINELDTGFKQGGTAASDAASKYLGLAGQAKNLEGQIRNASKATTGYGGAATAAQIGTKDLHDQLANVKGAMQGALDSLDPLGKAQAKYSIAVQQFGAHSPQAIAAARALGVQQGISAEATRLDAQEMESDAQRTADATTAKYGLIAANLSMQGSFYGVEQAQVNYNKAAAGGKSNTLAAKQALVQLGLAQTSYIEAAKKSADAADVNASADKRAKDEVDAQNKALITLARSSGTQLAPALAAQVRQFGDSGAAAFLATHKVKGLHTEVIKLPGGHTTKVVVDDNGVPQTIQDVKNKLAGIPRQIDISVAIKPIVAVTGGTPIPKGGFGGILGQLAGHADGGPVGGSGGARSDDQLIAASSGEFVVRNGPSQQYRPLLEAINGYASGGEVAKTAGAVTPPAALAASTQGTQQLSNATKVLQSNQTGTSGAVKALTQSLVQLIQGERTTTTTVTGQEIPALQRNVVAANQTTQAHQRLQQSTVPLRAAITATGTTANQAWNRIRTDATGGGAQVEAVQRHVQTTQTASWNQINALTSSTWSHIRSTIAASTASSSATQSAFQARQQGSWNSISSLTSNSVTHMRGSMTSLNSGLSQSSTAIGNFESRARSSFNALQSDAANPVHAILNGPINAGLIGAWNSLNTQFALGKPAHTVPGFASGGEIKGNGGPREDNIPIMASSGEFVVNASAASQHGPLLSAINSGQLLGFADGGSIGAMLKPMITPAFKGIPGMVSAVQGQYPGYPASYGGGETLKASPLMQTAVEKKFTDMIGAIGGVGGAGVARWAPFILRALAMLGQPASLLGAVEHRMQQESGGNPTIVNTWDSNAKAGHPSVGLMQVIRGTFASNAGPFAGVGPFIEGVSVNPLANIYAGLHHALGSGRPLGSVMFQPGGYDHGGVLLPGQLAMNSSKKPENIRSAQQEDELGKKLDRVIEELQKRNTDSPVTVQVPPTGTFDEMVNRAATIVERRLQGAF